jgi:hypothetical protein
VCHAAVPGWVCVRFVTRPRKGPALTVRKTTISRRLFWSRTWKKKRISAATIIARGTRLTHGYRKTAVKAMITQNKMFATILWLSCGPQSQCVEQLTDSTLGEDELTVLGETCSFLSTLGDGQGVCSCEDAGR